ncbi:hypothetical protein K504DRAFT_508621 [Pleomassaria siparia CBS 279.74]|uniref:Protein LOT5 n=1 Tax=Pleomassaria siparia CBS 279.74 TaxID=1314801 RepID=A0A6G1JRF0_9PLEO|nr:hypothetical protein K504DRAFT_508621 [Pleomassaria siparia CBS 279.74]
MALRHVNSAPKADDFTPLQEHQAQTPSTFFGGKPVLYEHQAGLTLSVQTNALPENHIFNKFTTVPGDQAEDVLINDVELWANSEDLVLFQHTPTPTGVAIPYPLIALHATMKWKSTIEALLINVSLNDADTVNEDDDIHVLEITVLPPSYLTSDPSTTCIKDIFSAMNTCADLHPDPNSSGAEDDGEEDLSAPGATGWITAENMDEYLDEDGNFRGSITIMGGAGGALGPGAGTVRNREEGDEDHVNGVTSEGGAGHEHKYYRTD